MDCLRRADFTKVSQSGPGMVDPLIMPGPVLDGQFLPVDLDSQFVNHLSKVDVLAGVDAHEGYFLRNFHFTDVLKDSFNYESFLENLDTFLARQFGQMGQHLKQGFLNFYGAAQRPASKLDLNRLRLTAIKIMGDVILIVPSYRAAQLYSGEYGRFTCRHGQRC